MLNILETNKIIYIPEEENFTTVSPFLLCFGTLRKTDKVNSNYSKFLKDKAKYLGTYRLPKFQIQSIYCNYTGNKNNKITCDLFEFPHMSIKNLILMHENSCLIDQLEVGYAKAILPIVNPLTNKDIVATLYFNTLYSIKEPIQTGDYLSQKTAISYPLIKTRY